MLTVSVGDWLTRNQSGNEDLSADLSVWRWFSLRGKESTMLTHCSNSSPCVIAAKANSGLGGRILPLNQHSVFSSSKGTFSQS